MRMQAKELTEEDGSSQNPTRTPAKEPARYQEAYHYQERQEAHLVKPKEGAIEKVNPAEAVDRGNGLHQATLHAGSHVVHQSH